VERTAATAVRFACRNYCNKRPDIIVVAHRGVPDADARARLQTAAAGGRGYARGMTGASGTRYRARARSRGTSPTGVRPLRSADGPKGDGGGGTRHMRSDPSYQ
jgi:hypothetical protein